MNISDLKDTIECRKQIVHYVNYLEKENEGIPEKFYMHVIHNIMTHASLCALKEVLEKVNDQLTIDVDGKNKTMEEADAHYNKAKDKAFKHCIMLEIKHNHLREHSKQIFTNAKS